MGAAGSVATWGCPPFPVRGGEARKGMGRFVMAGSTPAPAAFRLARPENGCFFFLPAGSLPAGFFVGGRA